MLETNNYSKWLLLLVLVSVLAFYQIVASLIIGIVILTCLPLAFLPMSRLHTFTSGVKHFYVQILLYVKGRWLWTMFDKATKEPQKYQNALLLRLIRTNENTEYGRLVGFNKVTDRESYRKIVPLSDYETYRPFINRTAEKGEQNLLTAERIVRFNVSSGTTGKCKLLPCPESGHESVIRCFFLPAAFRLNSLKSTAFLAPVKSAMFTMVPNWRYTELGVPIGPGSAILEKDRSMAIALGRALPIEAELYLSEQGQCYLHWFFALFDDELGRIDGLFAGGLLSAFAVLEENWQSLANDIRNGVISEKYDIPPRVLGRIEATHIIKPFSERAVSIERECSKGFKGIVQRLWPRVTSVSCVITGAHAVYRQKLQWYLGDNVRVISMAVMASEGLIGLNMDEPSKVNGENDQFYTLPAGETFMEFIPEENVTDEDPETLFMDQLERGKRYEIVVTSMIGFYRYRIGDIVEVVRHRHGQTPVVKFCARVGSLLDLRGEKTSEDVIFSSLLKAVQRWPGCKGLVNFTTTDSITWAKVFPAQHKNSGSSLFYVIFVEAEDLDRELVQSEVAAFDEALCSTSDRFRSHRLQSTIAMSKVFVVVRSTFDKLKAMTLELNKAVSNQYKTPRYLKNEEFLRFIATAVYPDQETANGNGWDNCTN